jgi:hypothetical protein
VLIFLAFFFYCELLLNGEKTHSLGVILLMVFMFAMYSRISIQFTFFVMVLSVHIEKSLVIYN